MFKIREKLPCMSKVLFWHLAGGGASSTLGPCMRLWPPPTKAPTTPQSTALPVSAVPPFQQSSGLPSLSLLGSPYIYIYRLPEPVCQCNLAVVPIKSRICMQFCGFGSFSPHCLCFATEIFLNMHAENVQMLASACNGQGSRVNQLCLV